MVYREMIAVFLRSIQNT